MEYREMKMSHGTARTSLLGFGCMRFPKTPDGAIDQKQAEQMLDQAIKAGVNYIDTAYPYHEGESEPFLGRTLKKYPRDSFYLATKLPVWKVNSLSDAEEIFSSQLERLQTDYVDFYLFHALNRERWENFKKLGLFQWAEKARQEGRIRYIGFSFHDEYEVFEEILTSCPWDFCQIQYNYMDRHEQAGDKGYELAEKRGIPLVIMEPVKGGTLAALQGEVKEILTGENPNASCASWALRWVGSHPGVKVILSGMSTPEQVGDNLKTFETFVPLSDSEQAALERAAAAIRSRIRNGCTACRYCMPCPFGVDIPGNFRIWNEYAMYGVKEKSRRAYREDLKDGSRASDCRKCGKCETVCPQSLSIRADLEKAAKELGSL